MAVWPESNPTPQYPLIVVPEWKTNGVRLGGAEQRRAVWSVPKINVTVGYEALSAAEAQTLWQFYMARRGAYEAFYIFDFSGLDGTAFAQATPIYAATADGVSLTYDFPGRSTSDQTVYVDGLEDGSAVISYGGGEGGADQMTWGEPLPKGSLISATFTGIARYRVRFKRDRLTREQFTLDLFNHWFIDLVGTR